MSGGGPQSRRSQAPGESRGPRQASPHPRRPEGPQETSGTPSGCTRKGRWVPQVPGFHPGLEYRGPSGRRTSGAHESQGFTLGWGPAALQAAEHRLTECARPICYLALANGLGTPRGRCESTPPGPPLQAGTGTAPLSPPYEGEFGGVPRRGPSSLGEGLEFMTRTTTRSPRAANPRENVSDHDTSRPHQAPFADVGPVARLRLIWPAGPMKNPKA